MAMRILDIPTTSISDVKRSPIKVFQKADQEAAGIYDELADLIAEKRPLTENVTTFSDLEARGTITTASPVIIDEDGWE